MVKKNRVKTGISNRILYTLIMIGTLVIIGVGVYALTPGTAPNPGHGIEGISPPAGCLNGQVLLWNGSTNSWNCVNVVSSPIGSLVVNPVVSSTGNYVSINVGGSPYLIPLYASTTNLVGGVHTAAQCTNAGGQVITVSGGDVCRFSEICPSGWAQYQSWSTTQSQTCFGTIDNGCPGGPSTNSCSTGDHVWSNIANENCPVQDTVNLDGRIPSQSCYTADYTCYATVTQIGCY